MYILGGPYPRSFGTSEKLHGGSRKGNIGDEDDHGPDDEDQSSQMTCFETDNHHFQ